MTNLFDSWSLFWPQIVMGSLIGGCLSLLGVLLVLKRLTFFGVTLSQLVHFSVALSLFFGIQDSFFPILVSTGILLPMVYFKKKQRFQEEVFLGVLFVLFSALSQLLLSLGGNVQNHLMAAYFGDILTSQVVFIGVGPVLSALLFCVYLILFRKFLYIAFDPDEYTIRHGSPFPYDFLFYVILVSVVTVAVHVLGVFFSITHLLVPAFTFLGFVRSIKTLLIYCGIFSLLGTWVGFAISLVGLSYKEEVLYFPTSSTIIVILVLGSFLVMGSVSLTSSFFSKTRR